MSTDIILEDANSNANNSNVSDSEEENHSKSTEETVVETQR